MIKRPESYSVESADGEAIYEPTNVLNNAINNARFTASRTGRTLYVVGVDRDGNEIEPIEVSA